jgi:hypothetical protein
MARVDPTFSLEEVLADRSAAFRKLKQLKKHYASDQGKWLTGIAVAKAAVGNTSVMTEL